MTDFSDDETEIVEVYAAADVATAAAVRAALHEAGIEARMVGEQLGSALYGVPLGFDSGPRLYVRESEAAAALRIIDQLQDQVGDQYDDPDGDGYGDGGDEAGD